MTYPQSSTGHFALWRIINRRKAILRARAAISRRAVYYHRQAMNRPQKVNKPQEPYQPKPDGHPQIVVQPVRSHPPPNLLNLPKEIKHQIAREAAIIRARVIPQQQLGWRYIPRTGDSDVWAVLRVNRQVHDDYEDEFLRSFYTRNVFHFSILAATSRTLHNMHKMANVRHVSLCFLRFDRIINLFDFTLAMALGEITHYCPLLETLTMQLKPVNGHQGLTATSAVVKGQEYYDGIFGGAMAALLPRIKKRLTIIARDTPERFTLLRIDNAPLVQWLAKGQGLDDEWEDLSPRDYNRAIPRDEEFRAWTFRP